MTHQCVHLRRVSHQHCCCVGQYHYCGRGYFQLHLQCQQTAFLLQSAPHRLGPHPGGFNPGKCQHWPTHHIQCVQVGVLVCVMLLGAIYDCCASMQLIKSVLMRLLAQVMEPSTILGALVGGYLNKVRYSCTHLIPASIRIELLSIISLAIFASAAKHARMCMRAESCC